MLALGTIVLLEYMEVTPTPIEPAPDSSRPRNSASSLAGSNGASPVENKWLHSKFEFVSVMVIKGGGKLGMTLSGPRDEVRARLCPTLL